MDGEFFFILQDGGIKVALRFECRCSHERARNVVRALPEADRVDLAIEGQLEITCDYCNAQYLFGIDGSSIDRT